MKPESSGPVIQDLLSAQGDSAVRIVSSGLIPRYFFLEHMLIYLWAGDIVAPSYWESKRSFLSTLHLTFMLPWSLYVGSCISGAPSWKFHREVQWRCLSGGMCLPRHQVLYSYARYHDHYWVTLAVPRQSNIHVDSLECRLGAEQPI
jgi:hypothetical protein